MIKLERAGGILSLRFRQAPRSRSALIAGTFAVALAALIGYGRIFPPASPGFTAAAIIIVLLVAISLVLIAGTQTTTAVTTAFDVAARRIRVATDREVAASLDDVDFEAVAELRLLRQGGDGTRVETLSLILRDGRTLLLARTRQDRAWSVRRFDTNLQEIVDRIRRETGLPGPAPRPFPLVGAAIGIERR